MPKIRLLAVFHYHLVALLLIFAGFQKLQESGVGELLQILWEKGWLTLGSMLFIARFLGPAEIGLGIYALVGWRAEWTARGLAVLFLLFGGIIYFAAEGYLYLPMDCGCFGAGEGSPVYLLLLRNLGLAFPLLFFSASLRRWTFLHRFVILRSDRYLTE